MGGWGRKEENKCKICDKTFNFKKGLKQHFITVHDSVRNIGCSYCEKMFKTDFDVKRHERIHTGEKPYQCSKCQKSFRLPGHLKKHESTHSDKKIFKYFPEISQYKLSDPWGGPTFDPRGII